MTAYYHGTPHDEDREGRDAAVQWAEEKLRQLGYHGPLDWQESPDQSIARVAADNVTVVIRCGS